jgi:hypothetical protein
VVRESLKQIIEDFGLSEGVFLRYFTQKYRNRGHLRLLKESF